MNRRIFLLSSAFSAGAFAQPALLALTVLPVESLARWGGQRVGIADVESLTLHLSAGSWRYGAKRPLPQDPAHPADGDVSTQPRRTGVDVRQ